MIIPSVIHSNKLYDVELSDFETNNDIIPLELATTRFQEEEIVKNYLSNSGPDSQNKYSFL